MNIKRTAAAILSAVMLIVPSAAAPLAVSDAATVYTVTFLDFDGNVMFTQNVESGGNIDYSFIDTSTLHRHVDAYTEQEFCGWSSMPQTITSNVTIQALSKTAVIAVEKLPTQTEYYTTSGNVSASGLKVTITVTTQLPGFTVDGDYKSQVSKVDITDSCTLKPSTLAEAFKSSDSAKISIYPIGASQAVAVYDITNYSYLGDVNKDGKVNALDASAVLTKYAQAAANKDTVLDSDFIRRADVNSDGVVDSRDASRILRFFALFTAGKSPTWDKV